jgi:hypothetical protein
MALITGQELGLSESTRVMFNDLCRWAANLANDFVVDIPPTSAFKIYCGWVNLVVLIQVLRVHKV